MIVTTTDTVTMELAIVSQVLLERTVTLLVVQMIVLVKVGVTMECVAVTQVLQDLIVLFENALTTVRTMVNANLI